MFVKVTVMLTKYIKARILSAGQDFKGGVQGQTASWCKNLQCISCLRTQSGFHLAARAHWSRRSPTVRGGDQETSNQVSKQTTVASVSQMEGAANLRCYLGEPKWTQVRISTVWLWGWSLCRRGKECYASAQQPAQRSKRLRWVVLQGPTPTDELWSASL